MTADNKFEISVKGMSCEHCEHAITSELSLVDGVDAVRVDIPRGLVWFFTEGGSPSEETIAAAIDDAGFTLLSGPSRAA
ncbi:copper chaperone CopZ [Microbacterium sp. BE35]|uniref:heavy-metal-associated domain-containing protein n=1 Tax=Microbacterium sp. BE35 TaxID=2817773 RepID=UPI00285732D4|nr:heavy-metal-associated domain-containing protein [Microbacterium sp. BE35]MDR7188196.1 copper chaperone CopZ [Microbacterium sp. BE35]